jgi:hypothetical protein
MLFPATATGVDAKYIGTAKWTLANIGEMDARAREPVDEENARLLAEQGDDLNRDIYLAYIHVEHNRVELHYFWDTCNAEFGAIFSRRNDGSWEFIGI